MSNISFFALGGLDERGKNLYCIEIDNEIFVFDSGIKIPERGILGIDVVIPNFDFLKENKNRIKGIFISKSSDECAEAIIYIIKDFPNVPIYGSNLTCGILKFYLQKFKKIKEKKYIFKIINSKEIIKFNKCRIEVFKTMTSIPNSFGYAIHTEDGTIIYSGDYMFDAEILNENFKIDLNHFSQIIIKNKILLFLTEASSASRIGYTSPNHKIKNYIESAIKESIGRIIFVCFDQDLYKINEVFSIIREKKIDVGIYGQILLESLKIIEKDNQINLSGINIKPLHDIVNKERSLIIVSGSGARLYNRLIKIATGNDELLDINENDIIILSTPPNPGGEINHANVLDELSRTSASKVIPLSSKKVWTMNASYEDIKLMVSLFKPKYLIPIKGLYKDFIKAKYAAIESGVLKDNIFICDNGKSVEFKNGNFIGIKNKLQTSDLYIDSIGISDIGSLVLNERRQLATEGVLIVGVSIEMNTKEIISLIDTQMRGVIYIQDDNNDIFKKMQKYIIEIIEKHRIKFNKSKIFDHNDIKYEIKNILGNFVKEEIGKNPIILAIINEI